MIYTEVTFSFCSGEMCAHVCVCVCVCVFKKLKQMFSQRSTVHLIVYAFVNS